MGAAFPTKCFKKEPEKGDEDPAVNAEGAKNKDNAKQEDAKSTNSKSTQNAELIGAAAGVGVAGVMAGVAVGTAITTDEDNVKSLDRVNEAGDKLKNLGDKFGF